MPHDTHWQSCLPLGTLAEWLPLVLHGALVGVLLAVALHGLAVAMVGAALGKAHTHPDELFTALVLPPALGLTVGALMTGLVCCHERRVVGDIGGHPLHVLLSVAAVAVLTRALWVAVAHVWRARRLEAQVRLLGRAPQGRAAGLMRRMGLTLPLVELDESMPSLSLGRLRPWVALSRGMVAQASDAELEAVLWHEASHARFQDNLRGVACVFSVALLGGLPTARRLYHLWREACELRCDDAAVERMRGGLDLAAALVREARLRGGAAPGAGTGFAGASVRDRVLRLLAGAQPLTRRALATLLLLLVLGTAAAFGMLRGGERSSTECTAGARSTDACAQAMGVHSACTCAGMAGMDAARH